MIKICKYCSKTIKGRPKIYDDYYFCKNIVCLDQYLNAPEKKYTIVLAGNYDQYQYFLEEQGHTDTECIYGEVERIMGIKARDVVEYGTFYERKDANQLRELAKSRII